jgi:transcriptional regulator GlxA family with amidase domain
MSSRVVVTCSNGFEERGFHSREAAEQWIDDFARAQARVPGLCDGDHTVKESGNEHIPT